MNTNEMTTKAKYLAAFIEMVKVYFYELKDLNNKSHLLA